MKDVVLDEWIPTKLNLYFCELYFIFYGFFNLKNQQVQLTFVLLLSLGIW
jgi:hypothetical protein